MDRKKKKINILGALCLTLQTDRQKDRYKDRKLNRKIDKTKKFEEKLNESDKKIYMFTMCPKLRNEINNIV